MVCTLQHTFEEKTSPALAPEKETEPPLFSHLPHITPFPFASVSYYYKLQARHISHNNEKLLKKTTINNMYTFIIYIHTVASLLDNNSPNCFLNATTSSSKLSCLDMIPLHSSAIWVC